MRSDIENLVNTCAQEVWDAWSNTNNALARRAAETLETKSKLQLHLHKVYFSYIFPLLAWFKIRNLFYVK